MAAGHGADVIATDAAERLLNGARALHLNEAARLTLWASARAVEAARPGSGMTAAHKFVEPDLAFYVAASVASSQSDREALAQIGRRIPAHRREAALVAAEALLARIDPLWAFGMVEELLGPSAAAVSLVGLHLESRYDDGSGRRLKRGEVDPTYARTLAADAVARAALRGDLSDPFDSRLAPLLSDPTGAALLPSEVSSYLVAVAAVDATLGLATAQQLLTRHNLGTEPLCVLARLAVAAGLAHRVAEQVAQPSFAVVQAGWAQAAALSGALSGAALESAALELLPRIEDECDPGRELIAGLPLLVALAITPAIEPLCTFARQVRCPPIVLADELLRTRCREGARSLAASPALDWLVAMRTAEWNPGARNGFRLYTEAAYSAELRRQTTIDALLVAASIEETGATGAMPSTLEDLLVPEKLIDRKLIDREHGTRVLRHLENRSVMIGRLIDVIFVDSFREDSRGCQSSRSARY